MWFATKNECNLFSFLQLSSVFLLVEYSCASERKSCSVVSDSLQPHGHSPWNSLSQNTRVSRLSLLWGIFPIQGSNPGLLHCRHILYHLCHQGSSYLLKRLSFLHCIFLLPLSKVFIDALFLGFLFCSIDLYFCLCATTKLSWWRSFGI